jgi:hypothetical protein
MFDWCLITMYDACDKCTKPATPTNPILELDAGPRACVYLHVSCLKKIQAEAVKFQSRHKKAKAPIPS